jgi:hypothetical protein
MNFRLDRTSFCIQTLENQGKNKSYWLEKSADERFATAAFLIANAFGVDLKNSPRMDKTVFSIRNGK